MTVRVQREDFDPAAELAALDRVAPEAGAVVSFVGRVRGRTADGEPILALTLEHYPGMCEARLAEIAAEAGRRWAIAACRIVHRTGRLEPGARIVLVATAAAHRRDAFEACAFVMDYLKTSAPFWKQETTAAGTRWVAATAADDQAAARWTDAP